MEDHTVFDVSSTASLLTRPFKQKVEQRQPHKRIKTTKHLMETEIFFEKNQGDKQALQHSNMTRIAASVDFVVYYSEESQRTAMFTPPAPPMTSSYRLPKR